jgi:hypothetical protein
MEAIDNRRLFIEDTKSLRVGPRSPDPGSLTPDPGPLTPEPEASDESR